MLERIHLTQTKLQSNQQVPQENSHTSIDQQLPPEPNTISASVQNSDIDWKRNELRESIGRLCTLVDKEDIDILVEMQPLVEDLDKMLDAVIAATDRKSQVLGERRCSLSNDLDSNSSEVSDPILRKQFFSGAGSNLRI